MEFELGQIVYLKSDPSKCGAVLELVSGTPENRFRVFMDGKSQVFYASQLISTDRDSSRLKYLSCDEFHSYLTALQIQNPGQSTLYSLNSARVDFIPYQFRPVLKFIRSDRPRLLIADGVGVGKTIEAGLILRELQARRDIQSVLIICPKPLITERKWEVEMKRFDEQFTALDGKQLRYCINEMDLEGNWPYQFKRIIVPYSLFDETLLYGPEKKRSKQKNGLLNLDPLPQFDLVIVDEAHHIRNLDTFRHQAVRFFCEQAEAVVFLTATPIQLGNDDLFVLMNVLRPDLIIDKSSFEHMTEPNAHINKAIDLTRAKAENWIAHAKEALNKAVETPWGQSIMKRNPVFELVQSQLSNGPISPEERIKLITMLESLHTFSGTINRTRRRDIGEFTIRRPETVEVDFTPEQKRLHDSILKFQETILSNIHENINIKFLMSTIRRQVASCLYGLTPFLETILNRHMDELTWTEIANMEINGETELPESAESWVKEILKMASDLAPFDPKLENLKRIIHQKQKLPNKKVMLFSSFRHTLNYLHKHLTAEGFRVGMIHGGTPEDQRIDLRNLFELPSDEANSLNVLLFSEIGSEGLDYQFCDCLINYDIPWNPMKIEQRIGRIDRKGQKSESVSIYNFITPGTIDAEIYNRCLTRIGIFEGSIGGSEEILGEITKGIRDIAENQTLNESERNEQLQQLADNKIRYIQEQERLEQDQLELFGIQLPEQQMKQEIAEASSFWLSPDSINRIVSNYIRKICELEQEFILGEKQLKSLKLSKNARELLLKDFRNLNFPKNAKNREWESWLAKGDRNLSVTFDAECASENPKVAFLISTHPLVRQAAESMGKEEQIFVKLRATSERVPKGEHRFVIYRWKYSGIKEDTILQPVTSTESLTKNFLKLLETAEDLGLETDSVPDIEEWNELDTSHHRLWSEARESHKSMVERMTNYRRESLITSHQARISLLNELHRQTNDAKIKRMRLSQINSAEADYERRIEELDKAMTKADILTTPITYGLILID